MFENLKDDQMDLGCARDVIDAFSPEELAELKAEFNRSGDRRASVTHRQTGADGAPLIESLRLENVEGLVLLTVIDGAWVSVFVANLCEELFK